MHPDNHLAEKISNVVKVNVNLLTESNLTLSSTVKTEIKDTVEKKSKETNIDTIPIPEEIVGGCEIPTMGM